MHAPRPRAEAFAEQWQHRAVTLGRQIEPREGGGHDFGRGGFEVQQEAQCVGEVEVREIAQQVPFDAAVEQAGKDRLAQQRLPAMGLEREDGIREPREHRPRN